MQVASYRQGFFMSEESEKAAKWDMVLQLKAERSRLSVLQQKASQIGKELEHFGRVLSNPSWNFRVSEDSIHGKGTILNAGEATVLLENLDRGKISALINDINETQSKIVKLEGHLKDVGI